MYGDWQEWRERWKKAKADGAGRNIGVNCEHLPGNDACEPCVALKFDWVRRHGLIPHRRGSASIGDAARKLAGL